MKLVARRTFIKGAGAGIAGLVAGNPLVKTGFAGDSPNDRINVAVIGIRSRGRALAASFSRVPNARVTTLCDVDQRLLPKAVADVEKLTGNRPSTENDLRRVFDNKDIDVAVIATPNHWHSLATIWACQAGKDVYVEKPASHNIFEGRKMVEAAQKYQRVVQVGTQNRSLPLVQSAMKFLHSGKLGKIHTARAIIFNPRESIGRKENSPVPAGVDWNLWLGAAPWRPFNENRFHYQWHWFWDTGGGETSNNGPHYTDMARWALQKYEHPRRIQSMGGYDVFDSDQETPNNQLSIMEYADGTRVQLEVRGLYTNKEDGMNFGFFFYTSEGWMHLGDDTAWATYYGRKNEPGERGEITKENDVTSSLNRSGGGEFPHVVNFLQAVRSRKPGDLNADILEGHLSATACHLCNIAYRTRRQVIFDTAREDFPGDAEANGYLSREYRYPFVVPEQV